jgi:hypothetical protein
MSGILEKLKGGDLRSIGRAKEVVHDILENPDLFAKVFDGMLNDDPIGRMRSADALEKVSSKHPEYLQPFKSRLINEVSQIEQQEVRWHVVQMLSYLEANKAERDEIIRILLSYLDTDKSKIVKVCSMQTLANLSQNDEVMSHKVVRKLEEIVEAGSPSMVNRAKKLLAKLSSGGTTR